MTKKQSDSERVTYRSQIARSLSKSVDGNLQVLSRESVSTFGITEWKLIERLEASDDGSVMVGPSEEYAAAQRLSECAMVDIDKIDDDTYRVTRQFKHAIVPLFES